MGKLSSIVDVAVNIAGKVPALIADIAAVSLKVSQDADIQDKIIDVLHAIDEMLETLLK